MRGHRYLEPGFLEGLVEKPANQKTYQAELAGDLNKLTVAAVESTIGFSRIVGNIVS